MTDIDGGKSGSILLGDQLLRIYQDVTFTPIGSDSVSPRDVVINKPGLYVISITRSTTSDNGAFWHGMCVIYTNGADVPTYYCKALGGMGSGAWAPYIYLSDDTSKYISLDSSNSVMVASYDTVFTQIRFGGGGFRIGAKGHAGTATVMIFYIG